MPEVNNRRGITLVEVLVASAVLSLFISVGYRVFFSVSASFQKGNWSLAAQNKLRNALNFVREEMQKASYLSRVQINGTIVTKDNYEFRLTAQDSIAGTANVNLAKWFISIPFRQIGGSDSGAVYECELKLNAGTLLYSKQLLPMPNTGATTERTFNNHVVIDNIASISLNLELFDPDRPLSGNLVTMAIQLEHPEKERHPDAKIIAQTGAKIEIEVKRDLP